MPIDPLLTSTVQVKELPPNPISLMDNFPHEVGDILSRATIAELISFIGAELSGRQYEKKEIVAPNNAYITDNFDMTIGATQGIGKIGGLWEGWAIMNGNNGTPNMDGQASIGWGANYSTVGQFVGSADTVVVSHTHTASTNANVHTGTGPDAGIRLQGLNHAPGEAIAVTVKSAGVSGVGKNIPPSMVILAIMKI